MDRRVGLVVLLTACAGTTNGSSSPGKELDASLADNAPDGGSADEEDAPAAAKAAAAGAKPAADALTPRKLPARFDKSAKDFPTRTGTSDAACWKVVRTGNAAEDYAAIVAACGAPTGMKDFVTKVSGTLDSGS